MLGQCFMSLSYGTVVKQQKMQLCDKLTGGVAYSLLQEELSHSSLAYIIVGCKTKACRGQSS